MKVWLDDKICDSSGIEIDNDGWPTGTGVFETIRTQDNQVFELARHMRRAASAAKNFDFKLPKEDVIRSAISSLLISAPHQIGRLRLLFSSDRFVAVHQEYQEITTPARLKVIDQSQLIAPIAYKTFPYNHRTSLLTQALREGFDEIICINESGEVSEGAVSNFLFLINGRWVTTPLSAGVLPGVQRGLVIERCSVTVKSLDRSELMSVSAALVISSLKIALPVASIDDRKLDIGAGTLSFAEQIRTQTQSHSVD